MKSLIITALSLVALIFVLLFFYPLLRQNFPTSNRTSSTSTVENSENIPENAFLQKTVPNSGSNYSPSSFLPRIIERTLSLFSSPVPLLNQVSFQDRDNLSSSTTGSGEEPLVLPIVADGEIKINPQGISQIDDYISYFNEHSNGIHFDGQKFSTVLKDPQSGVFLLPTELIQKALTDNNFSEIRDSLLVYQDFLSAKIEFLKSIEVNGEVIPLHEKMIAFDELTQELIQKALMTNSGQLSLGDFQNFYQGYLATAAHEHNEFLQSISMGVINDRNKFLGSLIQNFGLGQFVLAATLNLPFGGKIISVQWCPCANGWLVYISPPTPPVSGALFVPQAFLTSPLFYLDKQMRPDVWWLGLYDPVTSPCLFPVPFGCAPRGAGNVIFTTGTSL